MDKERLNYFGFIWHAVLLSITVTFTEVNSVIPAMILGIGGNEFQIGIATAIMIGIPLVSQLVFAGFLQNRKRKKPFLLLGINLRVLALLLIAFTMLRAGGVSILVALMIIYAELLLFTLGGAFAGIAYVDLVGKSFPPGLRRKFFTGKQLISSLGILLSALIARQVLSAAPYPDSYVILFLAAGLVLFLATGGFWIIRETPVSPAAERAKGGSLKEIGRVLREDKNLRIYLRIINLTGVHLALTPFYVAMAKRFYHLDSSLLGNMLFVQISGMVVSSLIWPGIVTRRGFKGVLWAQALLSSLLPLAALVTVSFLPLPAFLVLFAFTGSAVSARKMSQEAVVVELSTEENRVLYTGITGTLNLTVIIFPVLLGLMIGQWGYHPLFIATALLSFVSLFDIKRLSCPVDRKRDQPVNLPNSPGLPPV